MGADEVVAEGDVSLRRLHDDDHDYRLLGRWLSDERVLEFVYGRDAPFSLERARQKYAPRVLGLESVVPWLVLYEGRPVGYAQHYPVEGEERDSYRLHEVPELRDVTAVYGVDLFVGEPELWGTGVGTRALAALVRWLFERAGAERVVIDPLVTNERAVRSYEKAGFERVLVLPDHEWHEGARRDSWLMVARPPGARTRQRIMRPAGARRGGPAPWADLAASDRVGIRLTDVRAVLERVARLDPVPLPAGRMSAAVLVPLFEEDGEARVVLTRRASHLRAHRGEVAFPGGRIESGEAPVEAALREANEEVALDPTGVEVVGELAPLSTFSASSSIRPFVGVLPGRPVLRPNPAEVDHVFDVALADFLVEGVFREERWDVPGFPDRPVWFFDVGDDVVWGATARILHELLVLVVSGRTAPPVPGR